MKIPERIKVIYQTQLDRLRLRLAQPDALIQLSALGILAGLLASALSAAFRLILEALQTYALGLPHIERYEVLPPEWRFILPAAGGILLGVIFHFLPAHIRQVGIGHVIQQFHRHQAHLPLGNAVVQFFGGIAALFAGLSGGREGPGVHLGAYSGSFLGRVMDLPNNSMRILVGSGVAAAIAASFNTPLAGVIFAMEVIVLQYTLASFIPVILAASVGALVATAFFGSEPAFAVEFRHLTNLIEVPFLLLMGLIIGVLAAIFIHGVENTIQRTKHWPIWWRFSLAGLATGLIALMVPEVLGVGYDTAEEAARGNLLFFWMLLIVAAKLLATILTVGMGLPVGLIAPALVIGAVAGGAFGLLVSAIMGQSYADTNFYAIIGMGAMMGATLQAPLTALATMLELTGTPDSIMPAMVAIVAASLTSRALFGKDGIYSAIARAQDPQRAGPSLWYSANDVSLGSIVDRQFAEVREQCTQAELREALQNQPRWLIVRDADHLVLGVMQASTAQGLLKANRDRENQEKATVPEIESPLIHLSEEGRIYPTETIDIGATCSQAMERMKEAKVDVLVVQRMTVPPFARLYGVVSRPMLEAG